MESQKGNTSKVEAVRKLIVEKYSSVLVLVVMIIFASFLSEVFLSPNNILNVLRQVSANGILSIGLLMVIMTGGIDISIGSVVGVTSVMFAVLYDPDSATGPFYWLIALLGKLVPDSKVGIIIPIFLLLAVGGILGLFNGILICKAKIQPFIMTIGTLTLYRGVALLVSDGKPVYMDPETADKVKFLGDGRMLNVPTQVIVLIIIAIIMAFLLNETIFGRYIKAIGGNQEASRVAGINIDFYKTMAYVLSGVLAAEIGRAHV